MTRRAFGGFLFVILMSSREGFGIARGVVVDQDQRARRFSAQWARFTNNLGRIRPGVGSLVARGCWTFVADQARSCGSREEDAERLGLLVGKGRPAIVAELLPVGVPPACSLALALGQARRPPSRMAPEKGRVWRGRISIPSDVVRLGRADSAKGAERRSISRLAKAGLVSDALDGIRNSISSRKLVKSAGTRSRLPARARGKAAHGVRG